MGSKIKLSDKTDEFLAVAPTSGAVGALTGIAVNSTGYSRARFVFQLGTGGTGATFDATLYKASTSGGTYSSISGASLTQITTGAGSNLVAVVDTKTDASYPWLKVSGSVGTAAWANGCSVQLYGSAQLPDNDGTQQIVAV
jgi:hypothetical protein